MINGDEYGTIVLDKVNDVNNNLNLIDAETGNFEDLRNKDYGFLLNKFIDNIDETNIEHGLVNILGIDPFQDVFWKGNLHEIENTLKKLGLKVNTLLDGNFEEVASAELNIVLSPWIGVNEAKRLEKKLGTHYIVNTLPIGVTFTSLFLNSVAEALWIDADDIIEEEEAKAHKFIEKVADLNLGDLRFATITDSNYGIALNRFLLNDLGWIPTVNIITENTPHEFRETIIKKFYLNNEILPNVVFEPNIRKLGSLLENQHIDFILGSSLDKNIAGNIGAANLSISYPVTDRIVLNRGYVGYNGTINLIEDLLSQIILHNQN